MWQGFVVAMFAVLEITGGGKQEVLVATGGVRAAPDVQALITMGMERSKTFRGLARRLNQSDVVVYVQFARCSGGVSACLVLVSARPGPLRLLVKLDRFGRSPSELIALLAHELQHANEVASAPEVRDVGSFQTFFKRHGWKGSHGFETIEAEAVTRTVAAELIRRISP